MGLSLRYLQILCVVVVMCCFVGCKQRTNVYNTEQQDTGKLFLYGICIDSLTVREQSVKSGQTLSGLLIGNGLSASKADSVFRKSLTTFNPKLMRAGNRYVTLRNESLDRLDYIVYERSAHEYVIFDVRDTLSIYPYIKETKCISRSLTGEIKSSLWNAITDKGGSAILALMLSDIYAWQVDFFGLAKGDRFTLIYEEKVVDDTVSLGVDRIKSAKFTWQGKAYYAIPFMQDSVISYFDEQGNSLRKAFLKAPLKYSRISSKFTHARMHPVLRIVRPHHGVDYAAPVGTPVHTIGDGVIEKVAYQSRGAGHYLTIKHNHNYRTSYMHLSRYASGMKIGRRVNQGEVIGYVGSTGLSSGPHLDFRVFKNGNPINPLKMESPSAIPIKQTLKADFDKYAMETIRKLNEADKSKNI